MLSSLALGLIVASSPAAPARDYGTASSRSLLFGREVDRGDFHFHLSFGVGGGPENEGLFHAAEIGYTLPAGWTLALLHTFVQNKGVLGPERGPDLIGGWMLELKVPVGWPEFELKAAAGLGGLHDQSDGIRAIPGVGVAYGVDFHVPFFAASGLTVGFTALHVVAEGRHYFTSGVGLGWTFF